MGYLGTKPANSPLTSELIPDGLIATSDIADGAITTAKIGNGAVVPADLSSDVYVAKAWVNFNGTGTVAIRASGNVSSITDRGTGAYTVNFTTALPDADYASAGFGGGSLDGSYVQGEVNIAPTTTALAIRTGSIPGVHNPRDLSAVYVAIFR